MSRFSAVRSRRRGHAVCNVFGAGRLMGRGELARKVIEMSAVKSREAPGDLTAEGYKVAGWWQADGDHITCHVCPRHCVLKEGDSGFCFVRQNSNGRMVLNTYGRSTGFCVDPVEKKPLNHFFPGTSVLSFGTAGCNLGCKFCQAWEITKSRQVLELLSQRASPQVIAEAAVRLGCRSVAFTYNDPVVWAEYAIDTAIACRERGLKTIAVTAGYILPNPRMAFFRVMDAANVDLKGFSEHFYRHYTLSHLEPVLDTLRWIARESSVWLEVTNLIIPGANDELEEIRSMCHWIAANLGVEVPLHFTAFHPEYRMRNLPATSRSGLNAARQVALECGLRYVYTGNLMAVDTQSTYCPKCGKRVVERRWYDIGQYFIKKGCCGFCGHRIAGHFEDTCGRWGTRRMPVDPARLVSQLERSHN